MTNPLLNLIANPPTSDIVGDFQRSRANAQTSGLNQLALQQAQSAEKDKTNVAAQLGDLQGALGTPEFDQKFKSFALSNPDRAAVSQEIFGKIDAKSLQGAFFDLTAASTMAGDEQNAMLDQAVAKLGAAPFMQQGMQRIRNMPEGKEKMSQLLQGIAVGQDMDILPGRDARLAREKTEAKGKEVGAQKILEDGTIVQSTPDGPVVFSPTGEEVTGEKAAKAVQTARAEEVSNARKKSEARREGALVAEQELKPLVEAGIINAKNAADASVKAFERLEPIYQNIRNLREGVTLLDEGAGTGVVEKRLPSVRAASVKLDNLQGRLGLDIIQSTTFGSLSEAELRFALDTAIPQGLGETQLRGWLNEKADVQEKLADYLESAAIFLGTPGNTVADWVKKQKLQQSQPQGQPSQSQPASNVISFDAQGNRL